MMKKSEMISRLKKIQREEKLLSLARTRNPRVSTVWSHSGSSSSVRNYRCNICGEDVASDSAKFPRTLSASRELHRHILTHENCMDMILRMNIRKNLEENEMSKIVLIRETESMRVFRHGEVTDSPTEFAPAYGSVRYEAWIPAGSRAPCLPDLFRAIAENGDFDGPHQRPDAEPGWQLALRIDCADEMRHGR